MALQPLPESSTAVLEWESLRELLRTYTVSPLGQARINALVPSLDAGWIKTQHQLTEEIRAFRRIGQDFNFSGLPDIASVLHKSGVGGAVLEAGEIGDVLNLVGRAQQWRKIALQPPALIAHCWSAVAHLSSGLIDFHGLVEELGNKILPDGTLDDRASPDLARIRRKIEQQKRLIQQSLRTYLSHLGGAVQEELITIRGERFVLPIKVEQKRRVQGVVHGASSSGQTVYLEPLETIEQNNDLVRQLDEEQEEIRRILGQMSRRIGEQAEAILAAMDILAELELQFAKARWAEDYRSVPIVISETNGRARLIVHNARHPLLERNLKAKGRPIVPLTIELEGDRRQLIITGPNTGGKTVALKTVGLLALMAQAGLPVPADRAELPVFDAVLADIGDYQSIEQNLSTFSAHITHIDFISRTATASSLVLLDELGSATDPEEGAALAVALAEHFRRVDSMTLISTHHTALKVYAANTGSVMNAAVGFDPITLEPSYELKLGIPGASAGINIAQRLGLNPTIIASARLRLSTQTQDVSKFLEQLHEQLRQIADQRRKLAEDSQELNRQKARLAEEGAREQREKVRALEKKLDSLFKDFEYHAREAVQAIQDRAAAQKSSKDAERRMAKLRREFREQFDATVVAHSTGADRGDPHAQAHLVQQVAEGDTVKLKSLGRAAVVARRLDDNQFEVEIGAMKMKIPRQDIAEVLLRASDSPVQAARSRGIRVTLQEEPSDWKALAEINVIGRTVDEATHEVEKFLDRAFLAGVPRVRIIHGSGLGILRKALRQYLEKHPHVSSLSQPAQNEGGSGATVVELRT